MINLLRQGLPPLPAHMRSLPVDKRGYPVPWFVQWIGGEPNFKVVSPIRFARAIRFSHCWICGEKLGARKTFVLGTLNIINRVTSEPSCHIDCAKFAAQACPFLILPKAQYANAESYPEGAVMPPGLITGRNPGVCALWTTKTFKVVPAGDKKLIVVSNPVSVEWFAHGRYATRTEVRESLDDGLKFIYAPMVKMGLKRERMAQIVQFENDYHKALQYLPSISGAMFHDGF